MLMSLFCRVPLSANYIYLKCRNEGVFQYSVNFSPQVDSMGMRKHLLRQLSNVTGDVKAFDGAILFLPIRLPETVGANF